MFHGFLSLKCRSDGPEGHAGHVIDGLGHVTGGLSHMSKCCITALFKENDTCTVKEASSTKQVFFFGTCAHGGLTF